MLVLMEVKCKGMLQYYYRSIITTILQINSFALDLKLKVNEQLYTYFLKYIIMEKTPSTETKQYCTCFDKTIIYFGWKHDVEKNNTDLIDRRNALSSGLHCLCVTCYIYRPPIVRTINAYSNIDQKQTTFSTCLNVQL